MFSEEVHTMLTSAFSTVHHIHLSWSFKVAGA